MVSSGRTKASDETVRAGTCEVVNDGAIGVSYGRNIWLRGHESLRFTAKITDVLTRYPTTVETTA